MVILQYLAAGLVLTITSIYLYFKWVYGYWKRRNVPYMAPTFPIGNLPNPLSTKKGFVDVLTEIYTELKLKGERYGGFFLMYKPALLLVDPDLIKRIMTSDFSYFVNHGNFADEKSDPFSATLINLEDEKWRSVRTKLTPAFTSGKMKMMYEEMKPCCNQMMEYINELNRNRKPLDIKEIVSCYTTDIVGSCAFGLECNSFKHPDAEFRKYGRIITELDFMAIFRLFVTFVLPELKQLLGVKMLRQDVEDFFRRVFMEVIEKRESSNTQRNDFIRLLLEIGTRHGVSSEGLTREEMLVQSFTFFGAGFETSATNLTFTLYELSQNQDVQQKLRDEILEVLQRHNGEVTYEALAEMKYMDQVLDEALRKYPPFPFLNRKCNRDYKVPGSDLIIKKGTSLMIALPALQNDPEYYPNPETYNPERFSKENKPNLKPFTFLPFGDGPRVCIGQRFAVQQNKLALTMLLKNYKILPHESTPKSLELSKISVITAPVDKILLVSQPL